MRSIRERSISPDLAGALEFGSSSIARSSAGAGVYTRRGQLLFTKSAKDGGLICEGDRRGARIAMTDGPVLWDRGAPMEAQKIVTRSPRRDSGRAR